MPELKHCRRVVLRERFLILARKVNVSGFSLEIWINLVGLSPSRRFSVLLLRRIATLHVRSDDATAAQIALKLNRMRNQHQISIIIYSESFAIETYYT